MAARVKTKKTEISRTELFETTPVPKALLTLAIPTIISQLINLIYSMVDAFFIGRTGDSYKSAAVGLAFTIFMMTIAFASIFGVGGGSLMARLSGRHEYDRARRVCAVSVYGSIAIGILYSLLIGFFLNPILYFLGASEATIHFARQYTIWVVVAGSVPTILSMALAHLLRNVGYSKQASIGSSSGGILNMILDPVFMFWICKPGQEVLAVALATFISNIFSCIYLLIALKKVETKAPVSLNPKDIPGITRADFREIFSVGIPSSFLTGLYDLGNIVLNALMATHGDLPLAAIGIVIKAERLPNSINLGICQGMLPMVAYNYASGNHERMNETIKKTRLYGLITACCCLVLYQIFASPVSKVFMSTSGDNAKEALITVGFATLFLHFRSLASPFQFMNYHSSHCLQAMGDGRGTILHACVRQLVFYIPLMLLCNHLFGQNGLAGVFAFSELLGGLFALWLVRRFVKKTSLNV